MVDRTSLEESDRTADRTSPEQRTPLHELERGFRRRTLTTARLAAKLSFKAARRTLRRRGGGSARARDVDAAVRAATELVERLDGLKGLVMKLGQIASYMPGAMPPEAQRVLATLQAHTTALPFAQVAAVIAADLGAPPDDLFDAFEREPFAAASIGQVHRARVAGREVAVKVQYPGIEELLRSDLGTLGAMSRLMSVGTAVDGKALAGELRARTLEECDYLREAETQRLFSRLLGGDPLRHVPAVVAERTSARVITTELIGDAGFYEFADTAAQAHKDTAAHTIFRTCFECLFRHCVYNGDPHPGNYLFGDGGRVTFLDFGCVRAFEPAMIDAWKSVARSVLDGDRAAFERRFPRLGMVASPRKFDWEHQWRVMRYLYRPYTTPAPHFTYSDDYVRESYGLLLFNNPNNRRTAMPPEWLLLNRLQWGLNSILAHLRATAPWPETFRALVDAPTEPARAVPPPADGAAERVSTAALTTSQDPMPIS